MSQKKYDLALASFSISISLRPDFYHLYINKTNFLLDRNKRQKASRTSIFILCFLWQNITAMVVQQGWVAQITFGGSDPPRTNENIKDFIKTFNTITTPECYLSVIRENFQPDVGQNLHLDRLLLTWKLIPS